MEAPDLATERSLAASLVRLARMKAGLTQGGLAARAGVPRSMISAYEGDRRQPTLATLQRLLRAAGFDLRLHLEPYVWADDPDRDDGEQRDVAAEATAYGAQWHAGMMSPPVAKREW